MSFWEYTKEVIFERGVSIHRDTVGGQFLLANTERIIGGQEEIDSNFGVRPVYARCRSIGTETEYWVVLPAKQGRLLNVALTELQQSVYKRKSANWFITTQSLFFLLGAAIYHCKRLAILYRDELEKHNQQLFLSDSDRVVTQCDAAFYEFDSLVTAVIRALNSTRYLLWQVFGSSGTTPNSFPRVLQAANALPENLKEQLNGIWSANFSHAKEYRDCIQHYVAIGSTSWCMFYRTTWDIWAMTARIPDNPEARSTQAFRFSKDYDALTYAWELITDLFMTVEIILQAASSKTDEEEDNNNGSIERA